MNFSRNIQQIIPAAFVFCLSAYVAWASFSVGDPEPYLFPRLIALGMTALSAIALVRAFFGQDVTGSGLRLEQVINILPGIGIMLVYVFVLAEWLGFYTASTLAFLAIFTIYDPAPHGEPRSWIMRFVVTAGFMAVMYCVFALALKVQTPTGLVV